MAGVEHGCVTLLGGMSRYPFTYLTITLSNNSLCSNIFSQLERSYRKQSQPMLLTGSPFAPGLPGAPIPPDAP